MVTLGMSTHTDRFLKLMVENGVTNTAVLERLNAEPQQRIVGRDAGLGGLRDFCRESPLKPSNWHRVIASMLTGNISLCLVNTLTWMKIEGLNHARSWLEHATKEIAWNRMFTCCAHGEPLLGCCLTERSHGLNLYGASRSIRSPVLASHLWRVIIMGLLSCDIIDHKQ